MVSSNVTPGVKLMRKGTRSCQECRRRKIKCTYADSSSTICNECSESGRLCTSQGVLQGSKMTAGVDKSTGVKVRIAKLESLVERLSKIPPDQFAKLSLDTPSESQLRISTSSSNTKMMTEDLEHQASARPPSLALFSNDVIRTGEDLAFPPSVSCTIDFGLHQLSDREKLLSTISKETDIMEVLSIAASWWVPWIALRSDTTATEVAESLQVFAARNLAQSRPVLVATGLLCIAMSLQHIRLGIDDQNLQLSTSVTELKNRITAAVDQVVLENDDHVSCFEGVLIVLMRGKLHAENNQLSKAWLAIRRSILLAQKINLTQPQTQATSVLTFQCQRFVESMFESDRFLSMFLGMPYALDKGFDNAHAENILLSNSNIDGKMRTLRRATAIAAGSINDRNSGPEEFAFNVTTKIQNYLQAAAESMPSDWWDLNTHVTHIDNPLKTHEHLYTQFWFYQAECFLHLPYMLRAASDVSFEHNRKLCLNASRQLIKVWINLRQNTILSTYTCRLDDFQGLMSAILLLVGLLQYYSQDLEPEWPSFEYDFSLIEKAKDAFRYAAQQQGGSIAKQGLRVIETLSSFFRPEDFESLADLSSSLPPRKATLFVPYFGAITIESGPLYNQNSMPLRSQNHQQHLRAPLTDPSHTTNTSGMIDDSFDMFLLESGFDTQALDFTGNGSTADHSPMVPEGPPTSAEALYSSSEKIGLGANGPEPPFSNLNRFPTGLMLDWDKIMIEPDLNQDWDSGLVDFAAD